MAARSGNITLDGAVVAEVFHTKAGTSRIVATKGQYKLTLEKTGAFPDNLTPREDDTMDVVFAFDQKVKV